MFSIDRFAQPLEPPDVVPLIT